MWFNEYEVQDMEAYIKDLNLSPEVKTALSWCLGITKVSDLEGLKLSDILQTDVLKIIMYLPCWWTERIRIPVPAEIEISVYDVPMIKRLQNVLIRNNILYLSQLSIHPREEILKFRKYGRSTMLELDNIWWKIRYTDMFLSFYQRGI